MGREIKEGSYSVEPVNEFQAEFRDNPRGWLAAQAGKHGLTWLLAHADDGLIWGRWDGERLALSGDAYPAVSPPLRTLTLHQARLFGPQAELLVWRDGDARWQARLLRDGGDGRPGWYLDEEQLLWGDHQERDGDEKDGFTLVADGREGLRHAVPLPAAGMSLGETGQRPLRLKVRHYLAPTGDGMLAVVQSRLAGLRAAEGREESNEQDQVA